MRFTSGLPETACGAGSTRTITAFIRWQLPSLFEHLGIGNLLDAPCGDCNWISLVNLKNINYHGIDQDLDHLSIAQQKTFSAKSVRFSCQDVIREALPDADLMICRDFLQHLPNAQVREVLANFKRSNITWLLATSFDATSNEDILKVGGFHMINLCIEPFSLPRPVRLIDDPPGTRHQLGLWHRDEISV